MKSFDIDKYKTWLTSDDPFQRDIAVHVFFHCEHKDDEIDKLLIRMLKTDDNQEIRRTITQMFSERAEKKFEVVLFAALKDDDYCVRGKAYLGLVNLGITKDHKLFCEYRNKAIHDFERFCINEAERRWN